MVAGYDNALSALRGNDSKLRQMAIVWFHSELDKTPSELHDMGCQLKPATISSYFKRYANLLADAIKYFVENIKTVVQKATKKVKTITYWCYINKIVMPDGEVWTKIGQTTNLNRRVRDYSWSLNGIKVKPLKVEVKKAFECKDKDSMTVLERALRDALMDIDFYKFEENDRLLDYQEWYVEFLINHWRVQEVLARAAI